MKGEMILKRSNDLVFDMNDDKNIIISSTLYDVIAGDVMHDIRLDMVVSKGSFDIISIHANVKTPDYLRCHEAVRGISGLAGLNLCRGFNRKVLDLVGGVKGCFHLNNMILQVGSAAFLSQIFKTGQGIKKWQDWVEQCKQHPENLDENINCRIHQVPEINNSCYVCQIR